MKILKFIPCILSAFLLIGCDTGCILYDNQPVDIHALVVNDCGKTVTMKLSCGEVTLAPGDTTDMLDTILVQYGRLLNDIYFPVIGDTAWFILEKNQTIMHTCSRSDTQWVFTPEVHNILDRYSWEKREYFLDTPQDTVSTICRDHVYTLRVSDITSATE